MSDANGKKRIRFWVLFVILLYGAITGPGYLIYCGFISGTSVGEFPLFDRDIKRAALKVGGVNLGATRTVDKYWHTPVAMHLSPEMNPIGFNLVCTTVGSGHQIASYSATLTLADTQIWTTEFQVSRKKKGGGMGSSTSSRRLKTFRVSETGDYQFDVKVKKGRQFVEKLVLKVRRNVTVASKGIYVTGIVILVAWVLFILFTGQKKKAKSVS